MPHSGPTQPRPDQRPPVDSYSYTSTMGCRYWGSGHPRDVACCGVAVNWKCAPLRQSVSTLTPLSGHRQPRSATPKLYYASICCTIIGVNMLYNKSNAYNEPATSQRAESTTDVNQSTRSPYSKSTDPQVHNKSTTNQGNGVAVSRRG